MAGSSRDILTKTSTKEKYKLRMGMSVLRPSEYLEGQLKPTEKVGPFVRRKENGKLCFLTIKHLRQPHKNVTVYYQVDDTDGYGTVIQDTSFQYYKADKEVSVVVSLVKVNKEYIPKDIDQLWRSTSHLKGLSSLSFQKFVRKCESETSRITKFVIFAEKVCKFRGQIDEDYLTESERKTYVALHPETEFDHTDVGATVYAVDDERILHCVGIVVDIISGTLLILTIDEILHGFKKRHRTLQSIESAIEMEKSTLTASSETFVSWDGAVLQRDSTEIESLLESGYLPNRKQLMIACQVFSMQSTIIEHVTDKICKTILSKNPGKILKVWPGYRHGKENDIVFVVVTKEKNAEIPHAFDYDLEIREQAEFTPENKNVIYEENKQDPIQDKNVMLDLQRCINKNSTGLTKEHSNLTIIASSLLKSKGYSKYGHETIRKPCIVLYVHIKGIIPIKEKEFPRTLTSENSSTYDTDVREGYVDLHAGDWPYDIHTHVMMGCKIGGMETPNVSGTLGGFLEHPQYGLCALTSAHVLVKEDNEDKEYYWIDNTFICYQPNPGNEEADERKRFGCLKYARKYSGDAESDPPKSGLDFALVKVDTRRQPVSGCFPRAKDEDWRNAGFERPMTFSSGNIFSFDQMYDSDRMGNKIIKFGAKTGVTTGMLALSGVSIPRYFLETIPIRNLIRVNNIKTEEDKDSFSRPGDSGSLVFMLDKHTPTAIGLLVCGSESMGCSFIIPIHEILDDLNIKKLKTFK